MGGVGAAQQLGEAFDRTGVADGQRQHQAPEVAVAVVGEGVAERVEKTLALTGHLTDPEHAASPAVRLCVCNTYRQEGPLLIDQPAGRKQRDRSV